MATSKWELDPVHSSVAFSVRHLVVSKTKGHFNKWTVDLDLDPSNLAATKVTARIDASSIDTKEPQRDAHLRSADFLDADKFPFLEFKSKRVEVLKADELRITGDLTIRGTTREVVLDTEYGGTVKDPWGNTKVGFAAKLKIDRKEFGLVWNQALETGGLLVGDTVEITIEHEAKLLQPEIPVATSAQANA
ncbi:MAG: YceI family protein [Sandaracinaceae bacterium]|nr:YceI family protein [Sandaracinaceae bacterium]